MTPMYYSVFGLPIGGRRL